MSCSRCALSPECYGVEGYGISCMRNVLIILNGYYSCSLHGLIRGENMELGRDSDTGGQVNCSCKSL